MKMAEGAEEHDIRIMHNSHSEVFLSVKLPSCPTESQNENLNAQHRVTYCKLQTAATTKSAFCALHGLHDIATTLTCRRRYHSADFFVFRFL